VISFRLPLPSDLEKILDFSINRDELFYFSPSADYPLTFDHLQQICKGVGAIVMLKDKHIVGFANFNLVKKHSIAFISNVIIKPEKRQSGLGRQLLVHLIDKGLHQLQLKAVHLSCYQDNIAALSLYKKTGFKIYAEEDRCNLKKQPTRLFHLRIENK